MDMILSCDDLILFVVVLGVMDNCGSVMVIFNEYINVIMFGECVNYNYSIICFWVVEDDCGNIIMVWQVIIIQDDIMFIVVCCDDFSVNIGNEIDDEVQFIVGMIDCGSIDNCMFIDELVCFIILINFIYVDLGDYVIILMVEDDCGNVSICIIIVMIEDIMCFDFICLILLVFECGDLSNEMLINDWIVSVIVMDVCLGGVMIINDYSVSNFFDGCGVMGI